MSSEFGDLSVRESDDNHDTAIANENHNGAGASAAASAAAVSLAVPLALALLSSISGVSLSALGLLYRPSKNNSENYEGEYT